MAQLTVNIVTPKQALVQVKVDQVTAPSVMGEIGVLPGHRPLLASLKEGPVGLWRGSDTTYYAVCRGFVEVNDDTVTILAETAEHAEAIDLKRARKALKEASAELTKLDIADEAYAEQQARIRRAQVRINVGSSAQQ